MSLLRVAAAACLAAAVAIPALADDLTIVYKTTGSGGAGTATSYFSADKMRVSDPEHDTVVEYGTGRIVNVDHQRKEYWETTMAEMQSTLKNLGAQQNEQMANLPPAVREKMAAMMGGGAVTVTKGATRRIAGYDCQDYDMAAGPAMKMQVCATTAIAPPAANVDYRSASLAALAANPMTKNLANELKKVEGFSLAESSSFKIMGRSTERSKEATEVKKGPIPASAFDLAEITKGYKKVPSPASRMNR